MSFSANKEDVTHGARAAILIPQLPSGKGGVVRRDGAARAAEIAGLALAIGLVVVATHHAKVRKVSAATLIGKGQLDEFKNLVSDLDAELVIVDGALSPIQQRNLETALSVKVIDRTALILEIFGERAATAEGRLQVELAHLDYQQGRLVRSWTHLERQRGGFGFLGGPGETQIEADRRMIRDRMARLRRQLEDVRRTRLLHREHRKRAPWPVVALVGYTNAGKSTLFNALSSSAVFAEDLLFATLDPTMRQIPIDGLGKVILSDTVGFVSDLPTQLVAAFRATLEEVEAADLILHVRDVSHADSVAQREDVLAVLGGLGLGPQRKPRSGQAATKQPESEDAGPIILEIHNKIDLLSGDALEDARTAAQLSGSIPLSAISGEGVEQLRAHLSRLLGGTDIERTVQVPVSDGKATAWIYKNCRVIAKRPIGDDILEFDLALSAANDARLSRMLGVEEQGDAMDASTSSGSWDPLNNI